MFVFIGTKIITQSGLTSVYNFGDFSPVNKKCYKVSFNDDTSYILAEGTTIKGLTKNTVVSDNIEMTTNRIKFSRLFIKKFEFSQKCVDPYLMGVALCAKYKQGKLSSSSFKGLEDISSLCEYYKIRIVDNEIQPQEDFPNLFIGDFKRLGLNCGLKMRFIPENYLYSSMEQRKLLLAGLMDMNGQNHWGPSFSSCSLQLCKDVAFLIRSLGGFARLTKLNTRTPFYRVYIRITEKIFLQKKGTKGRSWPKVIKSIEPLGEHPCAEIKAEELVIDDFLVIS
jgi:hypothetical protein